MIKVIKRFGAAMPKEKDTSAMSEDIIRIIRKFMIFKDVRNEDIQKIFNISAERGKDGYKGKIAKVRQYEPGEKVIKEGEFGSWAFWVVKGEFEVVQDGTVIATFTKPGEIFGEMSVFDGIPRTASVVSRTGGVCFCIDMSIVENLRDEKIENLIRQGFDKVTLERLAATKAAIELNQRKLNEKYNNIVKFEKRIKKRNP